MKRQQALRPTMQRASCRARAGFVQAGRALHDSGPKTFDSPDTHALGLSGLDRPLTILEDTTQPGFSAMNGQMRILTGVHPSRSQSVNDLTPSNFKAIGSDERSTEKSRSSRNAQVAIRHMKAANRYDKANFKLQTE